MSGEKEYPAVWAEARPVKPNSVAATAAETIRSIETSCLSVCCFNAVLPSQCPCCDDRVAEKSEFLLRVRLSHDCAPNRLPALIQHHMGAAASLIDRVISHSLWRHRSLNHAAAQ